MMDMNSLRIRVCTGMSCCGKPILRAFEEMVAQAGLTDQVEVLSAHCLGSCEEGPCVRIDGEKFYHVELGDVPQLFQQEVLPKLT